MKQLRIVRFGLGGRLRRDSWDGAHHRRGRVDDLRQGMDNGRRKLGTHTYFAL